jgi:RNA recognition motif-containing protein
VSFADEREAVQARQELQHYQLDDWTMPIVINFAKTSTTVSRPQSRHKPSHDYRPAPMIDPYYPHRSPPSYHHQSYYMSPPHYHHYYAYPGYASPSYSYGYPMDEIRREPTPPRQYYNYYFEPEPSPPPLSPHRQMFPYEERDKLGNRACATLFVTNFKPQTTEEDARRIFPNVERIMLGTKTLKEGEFRTGYLFFDSVHTAVNERNRVLRTQAEKPKDHELNIHFSKRPQDQLYATPSPPPLYHAVQRDPYAEYYYDHRGNPATNSLFVDCLPPNVDEEAILKNFRPYSPTAVKLGTKELRDNEFRTCVVHFSSVDQAIQARIKLNGTPFDSDWRKPMIINFRSIHSRSVRKY